MNHPLLNSQKENDLLENRKLMMVIPSWIIVKRKKIINEIAENQKLLMVQPSRVFIMIFCL